MTKRPILAVLRGDRRSEILCGRLCADGYGCMLLSSPERWRRENLPPPGTILIAPKADEALRDASREHGFRLLIYGGDPGFKAENGTITAECALQVAMRHRTRVLRGSKALVVGWGNIGKPLFSMLRGIGADAEICFHRQWDGECEGVTAFPVSRLAEHAGAYDLIFNTAPEIIFTKSILERLSPGVLLIDLASSPGGTDREEAERLGIRTVTALRLPGLLAPVSGAEAIQRAVYRYLKEERYE